jgi:hypothetical protein
MADYEDKDNPKADLGQVDILRSLATGVRGWGGFQVLAQDGTCIGKNINHTRIKLNINIYWVCPFINPA